MKAVRLVIVGLGRLGSIHADNILNKIRGAKLIAACSLNNGELNKIRNKINTIDCYNDFNEMINTCKLDAVILVSSSDQHCKHSMVALKKALHVFCEKPLGTNLNQCLKVGKQLYEDIKNISEIDICLRQFSKNETDYNKGSHKLIVEYVDVVIFFTDDENITKAETLKKLVEKQKKLLVFKT